MRPIFITDKAMGDDRAIVEDFYHFYSSTSGGGIFGSMIGTGLVPDVYAALYYSGEVRNGGHQQFIGNSDNRSAVVEAALSGLAEIGALPQRAVLFEMRAWALENAHYVEMIFRHELPSLHKPGRPSVLDDLDARFFDEQDRHSVEVQAATWIKAYPDLRVVPEAEFMALLEDTPAPAASPVSRRGGARIGLLDRVLTTIFGR